MSGPRSARATGALVAMAVFLLSAGAAQARYEGNLNVFAGAKWLSTGDWEPVDQQREYGLMLAFGEERAVVHFAIDAFHASEDVHEATAPATDSFVSGRTNELAVGVRKVWKLRDGRPHLGAGAIALSASADLDGPSGPVSVSDHGYGVWVDGGVTWRIAHHLNLGLELRYSGARVQLGTAGVPRDLGAGGVHAGVLIGYGW